ncbi:MAG TPA: sigma-70 family RNA polymerase sigma factor [Candidatus Limnocylindrales bacterium]|nr:sigma-70 family RNA polymerase sigma factor [Candidatus Limnocylindrales bacterium]
MVGMAGTSMAPGAERLVVLAAAGDEEAFEQIVRHHHRDLTRIAFVVTGDPDIADQAAAATWVIAWKRLRSLREPERLKPWLCSIAANEARQLVRSQRRRRVVEIAVVNDERRTAPDPATRIGDVDLANAMARLSVDDRSLVALRYICGLNSTELAQVTGLTASGVRGRLAKILDRLRKELGDE